MIFLRNKFVLSALCLASTALLQAEPIKAMAWNLEWFPGGSPKATNAEAAKQMSAMKPFLEDAAPDIFLGQEIKDPKAFAKLVKTVPGMKVDAISDFPLIKGGAPALQQVAIASTLKANSAWFEAFKPSESFPNLRRGFAFAALEHPEGGLIMVYSVHFKSNRGSHTPEGEQDIANTRAESVRQIVAHKAEMEKKFADEKIVGWVVGGDFNTNDDGQFKLDTTIKDFVAAGFHNSWDKTPKKERPTWGSESDPEKRYFDPATFDYFITYGFKEVQAEMIPGVPEEVSDHCPIVIMLSPK